MKRYAILLVICVIASIFSIPYAISISQAQSSPVNDQSNTENFMVLSSINLDTRSANLKINYDVVSNSTFKAVLIIPGAANELLPNSTKNQNSSWNHLNGESVERDIPLQSTFYPNLWPFDSYEIDYKIVLNKITPISDNSQAGFEGPLVEQYIWNVTQNYVIDSPTSLDSKMYLPFDKSSITIVHYKVMIQHTPRYIITDIPFWIIAIIPVGILLSHWKYVRSKLISTHATIFAGVVVISFTILLAVKPYFPPEFTLLELILVGSIIAYSAKFCHFMKKFGSINEKDPSQKDHLL